MISRSSLSRLGRDHAHDLGRVGQVVVPGAVQAQPLCAACHCSPVIGVSWRLSPTKLTVPLRRGGVDTETVRGDHAGAVDAVVDAAAVPGERQRLCERFGIGGVDDGGRAQLQGNGPPGTCWCLRRITFAPRWVPLMTRAETNRSQAGNQQNVVRANAGPLHRAEGGAQPAAGHRRVIIRDAVRDRDQQPVLLEHELGHRRPALFLAGMPAAAKRCPGSECTRRRGRARTGRMASAA